MHVFRNSTKSHRVCTFFLEQGIGLYPFVHHHSDWLNYSWLNETYVVTLSLFCCGLHTLLTNSMHSIRVVSGTCTCAFACVSACDSMGQDVPYILIPYCFSVCIPIKRYCFFCILFCFVSAFCISYSIIYGISYKAKRQAKATKREEELQWRSHNRTLFSDCVCLFKHEFPIVDTHTHVCRYTTVRVCVVILRTNKNKISINILSGAKTWKSS